MSSIASLLVDVQPTIAHQPGDVQLNVARPCPEPTFVLDSPCGLDRDTLPEEGYMPKIVVTHSVLDLDNWLKGKSERADAIGGMGGVNAGGQVAHDGGITLPLTVDTGEV